MEIKGYKIKILILEDVPSDAELMERELQKSGVTFVAKVVMTKDDFTNALDTFKPDIILSDYKLPEFDGLSAIAIAKEKLPNCPVILVTGAMKEEDAVMFIKHGAIDYILKNNLSRLPLAVQRGLAETEKTNKLQYAQGSERMNKFMVGRELKMAELKDEIKKLKKKLDEPR